MIINHNISAVNTLNKLNQNTSAAQSSLQKLSSGLRINSAADDAAGLSISEKMKAQVSGLNQASSNAQNGISLVQTAEGALNETTSILQRMRELTVQAANDTNQTADRTSIQTELTQLTSEIDRIGNTTQFNGQTLLNGGLASTVGSIGTGLTPATGVADITSNGAAADTYSLAFTKATNTLTLTDSATSQSESIKLTSVPSGMNTADVAFNDLGVNVKVNASLTADISSNNTFTVSTGSLTLMIGANQGQNTSFSINDMRSTALGLTASSIKVDNNTDAEASTNTIDSAIALVSAQRSNLGAIQNRLTHTINNLSTQSENLSSAQSQITDVDMASEMSNYTKENILVQSATAMLAHANTLPQGILSLLQG